MRSQFRLLALLSAIGFFGLVGHSATITGTVKGVDGAPFQGAFVQAQNTKTKIAVNVLSDPQGRYKIEQLPAGDYRVQIRAIGYTAEPRTGVSLTADQNASFDFALQQGTVRWSDLSVYQAKQLLPAGRGRDILFSDSCSVCHSFQSRMAAVHRDADGWADRIQYMRTAMKYALATRFTDQDATDLGAYLTSVFGPDSVLPKSPTDLPGYKATLRPISKDALNIVYVEYDMPGPSRMPFSAAPDKNGFVWIPNFGNANKITRIDMKTGAAQDFTVPNVGTAAIHSAVPAPDGSVWLAEQGSNKLGHWDPATQQITEYLDAPKGSKHTVRVDAAGNVWSTGSPLTKFDPETQKFTRFEEVKDSYDVRPAPNGDVWFTRLFGSKLGKIDGKTMKVTMWDPPTPNAGPRRMEIAPDGMIWTDEYNVGKIASFDPKTEKFKEYPLPGPGAEVTPYALGMDADGYLWYNSNNMDVMGRFNTKTGEVTEYPFPHAEIYMREFFRDAQGRMWFASNPNNKIGYFYLAGKNSSKMPSGN